MEELHMVSQRGLSGLRRVVTERSCVLCMGRWYQVVGDFIIYTMFIVGNIVLFLGKDPMTTEATHYVRTFLVYGIPHVLVFPLVGLAGIWPVPFGVYTACGPIYLIAILVNYHYIVRPHIDEEIGFARASLEQEASVKSMNDSDDDTTREEEEQAREDAASVVGGCSVCCVCVRAAVHFTGASCAEEKAYDMKVRGRFIVGQFFAQAVMLGVLVGYRALFSVQNSVGQTIMIIAYFALELGLGWLFSWITEVGLVAWLPELISGCELVVPLYYRALSSLGSMSRL